ncbi:MAG: hypothetical protein F4233_06400, partial [Rhodospirillaceae bacterium]|nr:hypothetical protein [Rhodospirillaceae bacterium]
MGRRGRCQTLPYGGSIRRRPGPGSAAFHRLAAGLQPSGRSTTSPPAAMDPVYLTEEHNILRETARRFIAEEVQPHGDAWEDAEEIPRSVFARMGELGFFGVQAPEAYGGTDMGPVAMVAQWEELGKSSFGGFTGSTSAHAEMAVPHLINAGTDEQKRRLLPDLIAGRKVSSIAVTEPDGGSDVAALKTRAERKGNDRWVLNGAKVF